MNKLIIDGIDYTENKRSIYRLNKQNIIDDYIKLIVKNGKTEQENQQLKNQLKQRNEAISEINDRIQKLWEGTFGDEKDCELNLKYFNCIDDIENSLQKYKGDNNE